MVCKICWCECVACVPVYLNSTVYYKVTVGSGEESIRSSTRATKSDIPSQRDAVRFEITTRLNSCAEPSRSGIGCVQTFSGCDISSTIFTSWDQRWQVRTSNLILRLPGRCSFYWVDTYHMVMQYRKTNSLQTASPRDIYIYCCLNLAW